MRFRFQIRKNSLLSFGAAPQFAQRLLCKESKHPGQELGFPGLSTAGYVRSIRGVCTLCLHRCPINIGHTEQSGRAC